MTSRAFDLARKRPAPRRVLLPFRVPPAPIFLPGLRDAGPAGCDRPSGHRGRPLSAARLARALRVLPAWQLAEHGGSLSRLYPYRAAGCAASFAARVLALTTAEAAPVRCALAKEGSFVRVTAFVAEGGWHLAALRLLQTLDHEAEARRAEGRL